MCARRLACFAFIVMCYCSIGGPSFAPSLRYDDVQWKGEKGDRGLPGVPGESVAAGFLGTPHGVAVPPLPCDRTAIKGDRGAPGPVGPPGRPGSSSASGQTVEPLPFTPFRTCAELLEMNPNQPSGPNLIDPNGGDANDAIAVHCDFSTSAAQSCILPSGGREQTMASLVHHNRSDVFWLSALYGSRWLTQKYAAVRHQVASLQQLSSGGRQSMTYHCRNSVAYQTPEGAYDRGVTLVGWNEAEIQADPVKRLHFDVTYDGCKNQKAENDRTELFVESSHPFLLPFIDVGLRDVAGANKRFGIHIGMLCFY